MEQPITKTKRQKERFFKTFRKISREQNLVQWKNDRAELESLAKKKK